MELRASRPLVAVLCGVVGLVAGVVCFRVVAAMILGVAESGRIGFAFASGAASSGGIVFIVLSFVVPFWAVTSQLFKLFERMGITGEPMARGSSLNLFDNSDDR